uniref:Uncharacterized protein n=2 Tax=Rhinopithecus TaxID=542827 RepID=A0A2K6KSC0_RHIBE
SQISPNLGAFQDHCKHTYAPLKIHTISLIYVCRLMVTVVLVSPLSSGLIYPTDFLTSPPGCFEGRPPLPVSASVTSDNCSGTSPGSLCRPGHRPHPRSTAGARVSFSNCRSD